MSETGAVSGETVAYQYDTPGRLTRAGTAGPQWGLSWAHAVYENRLA